MPVDDDQALDVRRGHPVRQSEPDNHPPGGLALGLAVLSALFDVSYFFNPLAYLAAALAVPLSVMARADESVRAVGSTAVIIAVVAEVGRGSLIVRHLLGNSGSRSVVAEASPEGSAALAP